MASGTSEPSGSERCWSSFSAAEHENARSRVLVRFHFRFACDTGMHVGRQVGSFAVAHALRVLDE
jgi:hypothetical protein